MSVAGFSRCACGCCRLRQGECCAGSGQCSAWLMPSPLGSIGGSCGGSLGSAAWVVLKLETAQQTEEAARCRAPLGASESEQASPGRWVNWDG